MTRLIVFVAFVATFTAGSASAQSGDVPGDRLLFIGGADVGGELRLRTSTDTPLGTVETDSSTDLNSGGHVGLQFESPIATYFLLGYRFMAVRYDVDDGLDRNRTWFDFGISPTAVLRFETGKLAFEPRLGMPLGFSLHHWNRDDDPPDDVADTNAGFHIGVLGGVHLGAARVGNGASALGGLIEFGFVHHSAFARDDSPDTRYHLSMNQVVIQAGLSLTL